MGELDVEVVEASDGKPVAGARVGVIVRSAYRIELLHATTDARGLCLVRVPLAEGERVNLIPIVRAPGHKEWRQMLRTRHSEFPIEPPRVQAGESHPLYVALEEGTTIAGRVTDEEGRPVAGAKMGLALAGFGSGGSSIAVWLGSGTGEMVEWPPEVTTDDDGRFEWLSFPMEEAEKWDARCVLYAEHPDFAPVMAQKVEARPTDERGVIHVGLVMPRGRELRGTVLGPEEKPVEGASVRARAEPRHDQPGTVCFEKQAATDASGRFRFRGLPAKMHTLAVEADGLAPTEMELDLGSDEAPEAVLRLVAGCILEGEIFDSDGHPRIRAGVQLLLGEPEKEFETKTDEAGRFRFASLPAGGEATLNAGDPYERNVTLPSEFLTIRLPEWVNVRLRLVRDEDGTPLRAPGEVTLTGAKYWWVILSAELKQDGLVEWDFVMPGEYVLHADLPGHAYTETELDVPEGGLEQPIEIRVPRGAVLRGRVRDEEGNPLPWVQVSAHGTRGHVRRTVSDESGSYEVAGLSGEYVLVFEKKGFAPQAFWKVKCESAQPPKAFDATLSRGATVRGAVRGKDGKPASWILVQVRHEKHKHTRFKMPVAVTNEAGEYVLEHVPEGKMVIAAGDVAQEVSVKGEDELVVDFDI